MNCTWTPAIQIDPARVHFPPHLSGEHILSVYDGTIFFIRISKYNFYVFGKSEYPDPPPPPPAMKWEAPYDLREMNI